MNRRVVTVGPVEGPWALPDGWRWERLPQAAEICDYLRRPINNAERMKRNATKPAYELYPYYGATGQAGQIDDYLADGDYILLGEDGAPFLDPYKPKAYAVSGKFWVNNHAHVLKAKPHLDSRLLLHWLNVLKYDPYVNGTTRLKLTQGTMIEIPVPVPPAEVQVPLANRIDELFTDIDDGEAALARARADLATWRKALLKAAVTGELTADWRAANPPTETGTHLLARILADREAGALVKGPGRQRREKVPDKPSAEHHRLIWEAPESWTWSQLGCFSFVTKLAGFEYTKFVQYTEDGDLPVIKAENAGKQGFKITEFSRVKSASVAELCRSRLRGGDLLMVFVGAGTGNVAMVPDGQEFFLGPNIGMMRIQTELVSSRYVELFLRSPFGKALAVAPMKAVAQPSLSMATIRQIPIVLPPPAEQLAVVAELERTLATVTDVSITLADLEIDATTLRQSILAAAFRGQLA